MSYCRWSSDDFRCDLYCYESIDGNWVTHVAANRIPDDTPRITASIDDGVVWLDQHNRQHEFLLSDDCKRMPINGPYDGETFYDGDIEGFRDRLIAMRDAGYKFPAGVLQNVDAEIAEAKNAEP